MSSRGFTTQLPLPVHADSFRTESTQTAKTLPVALAHDYLTQHGGAERVVLDLAGAFPGAPIFTTLYDRRGTFPEFGDHDIRTSGLDRLSMFRAHHRLAFPLLAPAVSRLKIDADLVIASSSGWAHAIQATGSKIVYCHAPARWLYQAANYLGRSNDSRGLSARLSRAAAATALRGLAGPLRRWDQRAALGADQYIANSTTTQRAVREAYGIDAPVLPPPPALMPAGPDEAIEGVEPGFILCVARLLPYKNVDAVIKAIGQLPDARLVVIGTGPDGDRLNGIARQVAPGRVTLAGRVSDEQLRWAYRNCSALAAASIEDYGLTPLEAATFGKPTVALHAGGYLDTIVGDRTGVFFDSLDPAVMADALRSCLSHRWDEAALVQHADSFSAPRFRARLIEMVGGRPEVAADHPAPGAQELRTAEQINISAPVVLRSATRLRTEDTAAVAR
jgi:glycosyltransferase involved in cell wall biosynthesis